MRKEIFESEEEVRELWRKVYPNSKESPMIGFVERIIKAGLIKKSELEKAENEYFSYVGSKGLKHSKFGMLANTLIHLQRHEIARLQDQRLYPKNRPLKVYHGGCLECSNQYDYGLDYCDNCQYQEPNWKLPDLSNHNLRDY